MADGRGPVTSFLSLFAAIPLQSQSLRQGEWGWGHNGERGQGRGKWRVRKGRGWSKVARLWQKKRGGRGKPEPGGASSSSSSLFHLSIHHNGKRERLKAIDKDVVYRKKRRRREKWGTAGEVRLIHCLYLITIFLNYISWHIPKLHFHISNDYGQNERGYF